MLKALASFHRFRCLIPTTNNRAKIFIVKKALHTVSDLIPDGANLLQWKPLGITKRPVVSANAWEIRAFISTAHCYEELRVARQCLCQLLGLDAAEVNSDLSHDREYFGVDARTGFRSG
jgi:hypothetical protein